MKISLILLTLNEAESVEIILPKLLRSNVFEYVDEIYAIDGGSTDGTIDIFNNSNIPVISQLKKGRGQAVIQALNTIETDAFIFFSPDGNESIEDISKFRKFFDNGYDLIIASRMMKDAWNEEDGQILKLRKWVNNIFNLLIHVFFNKSNLFITDSINGFRGITKKAALLLNLDASGYTIEYQMTIRAFNHSLKIHEFPTIEGSRVAGSTQAPSFSTGIAFIICFYLEMKKYLMSK